MKYLSAWFVILLLATMGISMGDGAERAERWVEIRDGTQMLLVDVYEISWIRINQPESQGRYELVIKTREGVHHSFYFLDRPAAEAEVAWLRGLIAREILERPQ